MKDIEALVRTTLTDPRRELSANAAQLAAYRDRSLAMRRRRSLISVAAVAATVAVIASATVALRHTPTAPSVGTTGSPTPSGSATATGSPTPHPGPVEGQLVSEVVAAVPNAVDAVLSQTARTCCSPLAYVLDTPGRLQVVTLGGAGEAPSLDRVTPNEGFAPVNAPAVGLTVQDVGPGPDDVQAWSWAYADNGSTFLRRYDLGTLKVTRTLQIATHVFDAVLVDGTLWIAGDDGLYRLLPGARTPVVVSSHMAFSLAVRRGYSATDVYAGQDPYIVRYDPATGRERGRVDVKLGKTSLAMVDSALWVAGYDEFGAVDHKILRLDPGTLAIDGTSAVDGQIGPGAQLYAGSGIVWVDNYPTASCLDAATGRVLLTLSGHPPMGSIGAIGWRAEGGLLTKLTLPAACVRS
ncbi:MAG: hypothetical protein QOK14_1178 [Frankiaceae bacterium]|nr:hypothetical protein [Frankiaceae bacterium]